MGETIFSSQSSSQFSTDDEPEYDAILESDEDEESDLDDLPVAFTPVKSNAEFKKEDVLFAKYRTSPYWPAVFYKYLHKKKKRKHKAYVYFFDELKDISDNPQTSKRIIAVSVDKLKRFTCSERDELIRAGSSHKGFAHGMEQAEYFMRKKALGKMKTFFEYTFEQKHTSDEEEDNDDDSTKENKNINRIPSHDDDDDDEGVVIEPKKPRRQNLLGSFTASEQSSVETKNIVSWILTSSRAVLTDITRGNIPSSRHHTFHHGTQSQKDKLRWYSGFGAMDDECSQEVMDRLLGWFRSDFRTSTYSAIQYVSDVWLPEAYIRALAHVRKLCYEDAEKEFLI